ncbi:MAG: thioesterase II family protein [Luteimonas sp.]
MRSHQLLCLPFAGAGASVFSEWKSLSQRFDVLPIQLPGREKRFTEDCYTDVHEAVAGLIPEVAPLLDPDQGVVVFGHSLGAVLAYEFTRALAEQGNHSMTGLVVSGSPDPWSPRQERATGLDDAEFLKRVSEFAGYSHAALADPMMVELLLPILRADVQMHEDYRSRTDDPLDVPILMLRGSEDALISNEQLAGWERATRSRAHAATLPGSHMYLTERPGDLLNLIENQLL